MATLIAATRSRPCARCGGTCARTRTSARSSCACATACRPSRGRRRRRAGPEPRAVARRAARRGRAARRRRDWVIRENKWRAARYGLDAEVIVDDRGTLRAGPGGHRRAGRRAGARRPTARLREPSWTTCAHILERGPGYAAPAARGRSRRHAGRCRRPPRRRAATPASRCRMSDGVARRVPRRAPRRAGRVPPPPARPPRAVGRGDARPPSSVAERCRSPGSSRRLLPTVGLICDIGYRRRADRRAARRHRRAARWTTRRTCPTARSDRGGPRLRPRRAHHGRARCRPGAGRAPGRDAGRAGAADLRAGRGGVARRRGRRDRRRRARRRRRDLRPALRPEARRRAGGGARGALTSAADMVEIELTGRAGTPPARSSPSTSCGWPARVAAELPGARARAAARLGEVAPGVRRAASRATPPTSIPPTPAAGQRCARPTARCGTQAERHRSSEALAELVRARPAPVDARLPPGHPAGGEHAGETARLAARARRWSGADAWSRRRGASGATASPGTSSRCPAPTRASACTIRPRGERLDLHAGDFDVDERAIDIGVRRAGRAALGQLPDLSTLPHP